MAQEKQGETDFQSIIQSLNSLEIKTLSKNLPEIEESMDRYITYKKRICSGEFSTLVLDEDNETGENERSLTKEEKELCLRNLIEDQKTFINSFYKRKKEFAKYLYDQRLSNLEKVHAELISDLTVSKSRNKAKSRKKKSN